MTVENINTQNYMDIFSSSTEPGKGPVRFTSNGEEEQVDILSTTETTTVAPDITDTTDSSTTDTTTIVDENTADVLGTAGPKVGRPPKNDFADLTGYFEDRLKKGKFVAIDTEDAEGNSVQFIPKTPEEFDEVIDLQVNYQLDQKRKELEESWYQSKSPAWQAVAKYAEMTDDPSQILPFIQGVQVIDSVKDLNPEEIGEAEKIVRTRLLQRGDSTELIDEQIDALKTTDKLTSTAQKYKPLIVQQEKTQLAQMVQEQKEQEENYNRIVLGIRDNAVKAIEQPLYGKQKLKKDEQAAIYDLIAIPSQETKGYGIYTAIDNLFEQGDFEKLKKIALLLAKEDSFLGYISASAADKTAEGLQKKLRIANDSRNAGSNQSADQARPSVQRNQYNSTPKFGR